MESHNTLNIKGLSANPLRAEKLEMYIFNNLTPITMKNQVTMTNQEHIQFMNWRRENCIGFRTQCSQYAIDFESVQGLMDYYIRTYMSDVIEYNGIRFDSLSAMDDYIEANDVMEYIDNKSQF
jgi:hypothetical protein